GFANEVETCGCSYWYRPCGSTKVWAWSTPQSTPKQTLYKPRGLDHLTKKGVRRVKLPTWLLRPVKRAAPALPATSRSPHCYATESSMTSSDPTHCCRRNANSPSSTRSAE